MLRLLKQVTKLGCLATWSRIADSHGTNTSEKARQGLIKLAVYVVFTDGVLIS